MCRNTQRTTNLPSFIRRWGARVVEIGSTKYHFITTQRYNERAMEGNRKGFKYVKKTAAKEALAAPVVFEEIHSPKATTRNKNAESDPGPLNSGMKRKGGDDTNVNVVDSTLKGTSSSSSSSSKKPRTDEVPKGPLMKQIPHNAIADSRIQMATLQSVEGGKAHYPRIEYEPKPSQSRGISSPSSSASIKSTSHKATLLQLIDDICTIESNGLKEYAAADKGREGIISALRDVLAELPDQVSAGVADDTIFMPELNSMEKEDVGKLEQTLVTLRDQSAYLSKYEKDIAMLGEDHNLWMDGKFAEKAEKASRSGAGSELTAQVCCLFFEFVISWDFSLLIRLHPTTSVYPDYQRLYEGQSVR